MKATPKNLLVLTRIERRMLEGGERYAGQPALLSRDLRRGERYHADRLVRLGFLKKTRSTAPWHGSPSAALYWCDESCRRNTIGTVP
ncbi:MAG: hypothetical protein ABJF88_12185 [Rhodothermales bacterium]|jgi:hypothetical protein